LTQKVLKKKPRKGSKNTKPITKTEDCESFFNFFSPPQVPDDDEEIDEDTAEQLHVHKGLRSNTEAALIGAKSIIE
jgi:nucleosome assembly protein 1-like 1